MKFEIRICKRCNMEKDCPVIYDGTINFFCKECYKYIITAQKALHLKYKKNKYLNTHIFLCYSKELKQNCDTCEEIISMSKNKDDNFMKLELLTMESFIKFENDMKYEAKQSEEKFIKLGILDSTTERFRRSAYCDFDY